MARNLYGCTSADYAMTDDGQQVAGAGPFPVFDAFTGGAAITDLTDLDGNAISQVTFADDGYLRYYSPDNDKRVHWLDTGQGRRIGIRPVNLTGETGLTPDLSVGTVTTGTAAVVKSGTLEAPVFSFVLPSAGVNGVNTAALQDNAVTADKIAADAVGSSEIAANAVGTSEIADDAVTAAKIAAGTVGTSELADGAVTAAKIAADTITAGNIAANAVGASELADNAVDTAAIIDGAVTVVKLTGAYGAKTGAYTITTADSVIAADTTSGAFALTLPAASASTGKTLRIIKTAGANTLTVQRAGSDTIVPSSGTRTAVAFPAAAVYGEMVLVSSGTVWRVVDGQASSEASGSRLWRWSQSLAGSSTAAAVGWRSQDIIGTGSPLSVVTPDYIGQLFQDTAVTLGARTWRATTLASSGWVVAEGDTGWRDVSGLLENSWTGANCLYIRRTTSLVQVTVEGVSAASATSGVLLTLPAGFRPTGGTVRAILYTTGMTLRRVGVATTGIITVSSYAAGDTLYGTSVGMASSAWPTSALPGTAI